MGKYCDEKRGRRRDERGREERAEEERNCTARVSYRVITILGHFRPLHPLSSSPASSLPSTHPTLPPSATSSDIKLFIVHNGASSFVKSKKKEKYKWKKLAERTTLPARKRGASSNLSISLVGLFPWPPSVSVASFLFFLFFFLRRIRKHDRRTIDPKTLYGETRQRNAEYRRKFTFVMVRNKYLFDRTLFQLFIWIDIKAYRERMDGGERGS